MLTVRYTYTFRRFTYHFWILNVVIGDCSSTVVKVLCYKSEGRWFDPSWCHWNFHWHNPSDCTMALGSTQPLTEISVFPGDKGGRYVKLTTLPPSCAVVMRSANLNFLEPSGPVQACNGIALPLPLLSLIIRILYIRTYLINFVLKHRTVWRFAENLPCLSNV